MVDTTKIGDGNHCSPKIQIVIKAIVTTVLLIQKMISMRRRILMLITAIALKIIIFMIRNHTTAIK